MLKVPPLGYRQGKPCPNSTSASTQHDLKAQMESIFFSSLIDFSGVRHAVGYNNRQSEHRYDHLG